MTVKTKLRKRKKKEVDFRKMLSKKQFLVKATTKKKSTTMHLPLTVQRLTESGKKLPITGN